MGWVDIPSKAAGHWIPFSASWPEDKPLIERRVAGCLEDGEDVYFSVAMFGEEGRRIKDTLGSSWLWADLDVVGPDDCAELGLEPTVCWESSPWRYQALWKLNKRLTPTVLSDVNRALSYTLGADKGGWDLTQVLRPVGTRNFKYPGGPEVMMVYDDGPTWDAKALYNLVKGAIPQKVERTGAARVRTKGVPARARALLATPIDRVVVGERSGKLWELNCLLAEAGLEEDEIFDLVVGSVWNKWGTTGAKANRLRKDIEKAVDAVDRKAMAPPPNRTGENGHKPKEEAKRAKVREIWTPDSGEDIDLSSPSEEMLAEEEERSVELPFVRYSGFMAQNLEAPRWLIQDIWMAQSHGIIGGEAKASKSLLALAMGLSIASGKPFFGLEEFTVSTPGPVLMVQEENTPWDVQDKLRKMARLYGLIGRQDIERTPAPEGAVSGQVVRLSFPTDAPLLLLNNFGFDMGQEEYRAALEGAIQREGASMVILDPLYLMLGDADADKAKDVRGFQKWLLSLRYTYGCAVVLVHHFGKPREGTGGYRPGHRLLGSGTWYNWVDSAMYAEAKESVGVQWNRGVGPKKMPKVNRVLSVAREWRSAAAAETLGLKMHIGKPGSLRLMVQAHVGNPMSDEIHRAVEAAGVDGINATELAQVIGADRRTVVKYVVGSGNFRVEGSPRGRGQSYRVFSKNAGSGRQLPKDA